MRALAQKAPQCPVPLHADPVISILQGQSLNGASFTSVQQLQEHIDAFIKAYNDTAVPFEWTKKRVYQRRFKNRRITQL